MCCNNSRYTPEVVAIIILVLAGLALIFTMGYVVGLEVGYNECLDDHDWVNRLNINL